MYFDPLFLVFAIPGLLLGLYAQSRVKSNFNKFAKVRTARNVTGAEVARQLLDAQGLYDVTIEETQGFLSDHYDPRGKVLRLSPGVYRTPSIAAAGVAAHEMGHALGFISNVGGSSTRLSVWDIFRFRPGTTLSTFTTAQRILTTGGEHRFFDGTPELACSTGGPSGTGGDGTP